MVDDGTGECGRNRFKERSTLKLGCNLTYLLLVDTSTDGMKRINGLGVLVAYDTWICSRIQRRSCLVTSAVLNAIIKSEGPAFLALAPKQLSSSRYDTTLE